MTSKYNPFFESSRKKALDEKRNKKRSLSFDEKHTLPKELKSRDTIEKGFKEYLSNKKTDEEDFERKYISPPFEVSRVPSPVYGYNRPAKRETVPTDYAQLKKDMIKEACTFILFEEYAPLDKPELTKDEKKIAAIKEKTKQPIRRGYGLHRSLASIIEEEKSGNNSNKSEVPGLFLPDNKR